MYIGTNQHLNNYKVYIDNMKNPITKQKQKKETIIEIF